MKHPLLVLCGVGAGSNTGLPSLGPVQAEPPGFVGLPWGEGDPVAAGLHRPTWAVVRVATPIPVGGTAAAVSFTRGEVLYAGDPRGALETLIANGADPARMSAQLGVPGVGGLARVGAYGFAVAGIGGLAEAGRFGRAVVGAGGLAVAGTRGSAVSQWSHGVAACGAEGTAEAGDEGMAFATGHAASATVGAFGVAAATARASRLVAGEQGLVVALRGAGLVQAGLGGIAVSLDAIEGRDRVAVAPGGLAILRFRTDDDAVHFALSTGIDHLASGGRPLVFWQGQWLTPDAIPEHARPAAPEPETAADEDVAEAETIIPVIALQPDEVLVLCAVPDAVADTEHMESESWDPDPSSDSGFTGVLWGEGDARGGGLPWGDAWALVRVPAASVVRDRSRHAGVVRFHGGPICYCGGRRGALQRLLALGRKPAHLVGQVATAGADGVAAVRNHGAALAGPRGWAMAWSNAEAEAGAGGMAHASEDSVARAGAHGIAMAGQASSGPRGIAISLGKRYGSAAAGNGGIAIGAGRFKLVRAGDGGAAIATSYGARIVAGDDAVAIGGDRVRAGRNGVAIALDGTVAGAVGCLLVRRWQDEDGHLRYAMGIVGQDGIEPYVAYEVAEGRLHPATPD